MKHTNLPRACKGFLLLLSFLLAGITGLNAQTLIPATSFEYTFPGGAPAGDLPTCYSWANINFGGSSVYDGYLSAVNGELQWQMTVPSTPSSIFNQGTIAYPGCMDLNVGYMWGGSPLAVVSYYMAGTGHFYDVYKWNTAGLFLVSSTQVSTMPTYTRISMDSHKTYGMVIVWEDAMDIYCVTGLSGSFSTPILLGGTGNMKRPDVAFSHIPTILNVQFVYNLQTGPVNYRIYETVADFFALHGSAGFYTPTVQDVNGVTVQWSELTASIDCPDHYSVENWAYTYAIDGMDIYVRSIDYNSLGFPITTNVVNGSLGNVPMWAKELRPRIAYNQSGTSFHVAWYSSYSVWPDGQCYFAEEIKESAAGLVSSADYLLVAANSAFPAGASLNSIAFSKQNDYSPFLYTVFLDAGGIYHKFHPWTLTSSFKTEPNEQLHALRDNCSELHSKPQAKHELKPELRIGPNPFTSDIRLFVPDVLSRENIKITITDIGGRIVLQHEGMAGSASEAIEKAGKELSAGSYFVNANMEKAGVVQHFKLQKINNGN
jgi:hypothetical protein